MSLLAFAVGFLSFNSSILWSLVTQIMKWNDTVYSLSCISKYNESLAKKFLIMMCNKFSAGRAEKYFLMHWKACKKSPK